METIKNYLETMFSTLPNTYEVQKAKKELAQMMEDKYTELINDGKTDNEAVGIVISEFGNLDELAEDLGIKDLVVKEPVLNSRKVTMDEAKDFIANRIRYGLYIGGICYRARFENGIAAGEIAQSIQTHYTNEDSVILFMSYEK